MTPMLFWIVFLAIITFFLALDLGVFHRKSHVVTTKEAMGWTITWVALASLFGGLLWMFRGPETALTFATGYLIELSLSADNVFVFALIFSFFAVPSAYRHRLLFWGVISALVLRLVMILAGAALLERFHWIIYVFAALLILTGFKMLFGKSNSSPPDRNPLVRAFRAVFPTTDDYSSDHFFVRKGGKLMATPLMVVLVAVEASDVMFAVDSVPAIFAVTRDPFIVFTSNAFAILGLRSLYFLLEGLMDRFIYLGKGLGIILTWVGIKMALSHTPWKPDTVVSLGIVVTILIGSIVLSLKATAKKPVASSSGENPTGTPALES